MRAAVHAAVVASALAAALPAAAQSTADLLEDGEVLRTGALEGSGRHEASGTVSIVAHGGQTYAVLSEDFLFDGAPDPYVGFGNGANFNSDTTFAPLYTDAGAHAYRLPKKVTAEDFDTFFLWCQEFSVTLASAPLR